MDESASRVRDERASRVEHLLRIPMIVISLLVIPVVYLQLSDVHGTLATVTDVLDWVVWLGFTVEAAAMLWVVQDRAAWIKENPFSLPIVLLTGPFLPGDHTVLRILRLLRLTRSFSTLRHYLSLDGLPFLAVLTTFTVIASGMAFSEVEKGYSPWDGIWWAMVTITTVGYGDISPQTDEGRALGMALMAVGIGFVALLTAALAQSFVRSVLDEDVAPAETAIEARLAELSERLERIERSLDARGRG